VIVAAEMLKERGARKVVAAATHGIFAGDALELFDQSSIERVYVTDSLPLPIGKAERIEIVPVAPMLAEAIMRIHKDLSISALFS
jgi:ribose-phosphate pyrophosphokinase